MRGKDHKRFPKESPGKYFISLSTLFHDEDGVGEYDSINIKIKTTMKHLNAVNTLARQYDLVITLINSLSKSYYLGVGVACRLVFANICEVQIMHEDVKRNLIIESTYKAAHG